ncbi:MAG: hypothetical protein HOW73_18235 [Polyangiaceae bacterium]|nr:hypothetical protein [Polyangiaceae bacterium]
MRHIPVLILFAVVAACSETVEVVRPDHDCGRLDDRGDCFYDPHCDWAYEPGNDPDDTGTCRQSCDVDDDCPEGQQCLVRSVWTVDQDPELLVCVSDA